MAFFNNRYRSRLAAEKEQADAEARLEQLKEENPAVPDLLTNIGGSNLLENPAVQAGFAALLARLRREGATSPERLAAIRNQIAAGRGSSTIAAINSALADAGRNTAARADAIEGSLADQRKRQNLSAVLSMIVEPGLRKRGAGLTDIRTSVQSDIASYQRRNDALQGISNILGGVSSLIPDSKRPLSKGKGSS